MAYWKQIIWNFCRHSLFTDLIIIFWLDFRLDATMRQQQEDRALSPGLNSDLFGTPQGVETTPKRWWTGGGSLLITGGMAAIPVWSRKLPNQPMGRNKQLGSSLASHWQPAKRNNNQLSGISVTIGWDIFLQLIAYDYPWRRQFLYSSPSLSDRSMQWRNHLVMGFCPSPETLWLAIDPMAKKSFCDDHGVAISAKQPF